MKNVKIEGFVESEGIIAVKRNSGVYDYIPIKTEDQIPEGSHVCICGSLVTENVVGDDKMSHKKMYILGSVTEPTNTYLNSVDVTGFICRKDAIRKTPLGKTIIDFVLAINYKELPSSYVSCIAWHKNAKYVDTLSVGDKVHIKARFQSREYLKNEEVRTAYELSVSEIAKENNNEL